jgi:hypothetical protein
VTASTIPPSHPRGLKTNIREFITMLAQTIPRTKRARQRLVFDSEQMLRPCVTSPVDHLLKISAQNWRKRNERACRIGQPCHTPTSQQTLLTSLAKNDLNPNRLKI